MPKDSFGTIREIDGMNEKLRIGVALDTTFSFFPEEFNRRENNILTMDMNELETYIQDKKMRGAEGLQFDEVEKYRRSSFPFATFILTIIGVSLSSRKVRGGIGLQIGAGILLSFTYIMFMQVSTTFATNGNFPAIIAVWIPNIVYAVVAVFLMRNAPK
jgi:lipopolysaccharide export system permease protein